MVFVRPVAKLWREKTKIGKIFQHRVPAQILQNGFCTPPWWDFVRPPCGGEVQWGAYNGGAYKSHNSTKSAWKKGCSMARKWLQQK